MKYKKIKIAAIASLTFITMVIADYILGDTAEYLNAWYFLKYTFGNNDISFIYLKDELGIFAWPFSLIIYFTLHTSIGILLLKLYSKICGVGK